MSRPPPTARSLQDLGALKDTLQTAAREEAERIARERAEAARRERERNLFSLSIGAVRPLPDPHRSRQRPAPAAPEPLQRERDEQAALRETISDEFDTASLLETDDSLSFRRPEIGLDVLRKLRRGGWTLQAQLDLHGLRRDDARVQLNAFIRDAAAQGLRCVRVVHGKGLGSPGREPVLKARVRNWLVQKSEVLAFVQARPAEGGSGALVVLLKATA